MHLLSVPELKQPYIFVEPVFSTLLECMRGVEFSPNQLRQLG